MKRWKGVFPAGDYMRAADDWHNFQTRLSVIDICSCLSEIVYALASGFIFRGTSRVFSKVGGWHLEVAESMVHVYEIHLPSSVECRSVLSISALDRYPWSTSWSNYSIDIPIDTRSTFVWHLIDSWSIVGWVSTNSYALIENTYCRQRCRLSVDRAYHLRCRWSVD